MYPHRWLIRTGSLSKIVILRDIRSLEISQFGLNMLYDSNDGKLLAALFGDSSRNGKTGAPW